MYDNEMNEHENRSRENGNGSVDGAYRYVRPESKEMLYRDANVEPAEEAARMPRCYVPPQKNAKDKGKGNADSRQSDDEDEPYVPDARLLRCLWKGAVCLCVCCALIGGLIGGAVATLMFRNGTSDTTETGDDAGDALSVGDVSGANVFVTPMPSACKTPGEIYKAACGQVVGVTTEVSYHNMFGITVSQPVSGSGFFISEDGYVLTNYHVIEYAAEYGSTAKVIAHDGTEYIATVVGSDPDNDIAVLQVDASGLEYAALGNSDGIAVGDEIYAVGNPLGELQFSMTTGSISATNRLISTKDTAPAINMFQIDAAVNQGNSGGPVYDTTGQVIGVVTAKYSDEGIEGLGFAIPINDAVSIATQLITTGYVSGKAKLGVDAQTMSARAAMYYHSVEGAYIRYIDPESCAALAGLELGDVVYRFGDLDIYSRDDLQLAIRSYHAGDTVELSVYRNGAHLTISVTLDEDVPETVKSSNPDPVFYSPYANTAF